ncbi:MAG: hypothetical protein U5L45_12430 [Saprospiraceae bacterium]|nr:hypothetical protein [Saprospiraceae bacterium]
MVHFSAKPKNEPPLLPSLREQNVRKLNIYLESSKRYQLFSFSSRSTRFIAHWMLSR